MMSKNSEMRKQINDKENKIFVKNETAIAMPPNANTPNMMASTRNKIAHSEIMWFPFIS